MAEGDVSAVQKAIEAAEALKPREEPSGPPEGSQVGENAGSADPKVVEGFKRLSSCIKSFQTELNRVHKSCQAVDLLSPFESFKTALTLFVEESRNGQYSEFFAQITIPALSESIKLLTDISSKYKTLSQLPSENKNKLQLLTTIIHKIWISAENLLLVIEKMIPTWPENYLWKNFDKDLNELCDSLYYVNLGTYPGILQLFL